MADKKGSQPSMESKASTKEDIRRMMRQVAAKMQSQSSSARQPAGVSALPSPSAAASSTSAQSDSAGLTDTVRGHPFARYNSLNQLTCIICGCPVKSSLLWRAHLASRQHRTNAEALKSRGGDRAVDILSGAGLKRRLESAKQKQLQQSGLGLAYSDDESDGEEAGDGGGGEGGAKKLRRSSDAAASSLPGKSMPAAVARRRQPGGAAKSQQQQQPGQQPLPEGFFDDPVADARARHVPFRDKMEAELELFALEMRHTQAESEQIAEADEEEADNVRYMEEIIQQEETWHRLNELEIMKEAAAVKQEVELAVKLEKPPDEADAASDELEEDDFDWRRKKL